MENTLNDYTQSNNQHLSLVSQIQDMTIVSNMSICVAMYAYIQMYACVGDYMIVPLPYPRFCLSITTTKFIKLSENQPLSTPWLIMTIHLAKNNQQQPCPMLRAWRHSTSSLAPLHRKTAEQAQQNKPFTSRDRGTLFPKATKWRFHLSMLGAYHDQT